MHPTKCDAYFNDMINQYDELIIWLLPLSGKYAVYVCVMQPNRASVWVDKFYAHLSIQSPFRTGSAVQGAVKWGH